MSAVYLKGIASITPGGVNEDVHRVANRFHEKQSMIPDLSFEDYGLTGLHRISKPGQLSCIAIREALLSANLPEKFEEIDESYATGLVIGTSFTNLEPILKMDQEAHEYGPNNVNPSIFPNTVLNAIGGYVSIAFQIKGTNTTISQGDHSGVKALQYGYDLLLNQKVKRVVVCIHHLYPPSAFKTICKTDLPYESVVAFVLESSEEIQSNLLRMDMENVSADQVKTKQCLCVELPLQMVSASKKLWKGFSPQQKWYVDTEEKELILITLGREEESNCYD